MFCRTFPRLMKRASVSDQKEMKMISFLFVSVPFTLPGLAQLVRHKGFNAVCFSICSLRPCLNKTGLQMISLWWSVVVASLTFSLSHAKENSFYSSSDSEDEEEPRKFHVQIKPVQPNNGTHQNRATIDELKASIGNIILSPSTSVQLHNILKTQLKSKPQV